MRFVDTNVFIRFITRDDEMKAAAARDFFRRVAADEEQAVTCEAVLAEVAYVLTRSRRYDASHDEVADALRPLIELPGFRLPHKRIYLRALDLYVTHPFLDLEDALQVAHMEDQGIEEIVSYDTDFDRVPGITRTEP